MPDISMCPGGSCPLRLNCHRYTATPDELLQSYFTEAPYKMNMMLDNDFASVGVVTITCPYFWNNAKYKKHEKESKNTGGLGEN
jgi:hypothetical protein